MSTRILRLVARLLAVAVIAGLVAVAVAVQVTRPQEHPDPDLEDAQYNYFLTLCMATMDFDNAALAFLEAPAPAPAPTAPAINVTAFVAGMPRSRDHYANQYNAEAERAGPVRMANLHLPDRINPANLNQCPP